MPTQITPHGTGMAKLGFGECSRSSDGVLQDGTGMAKLGFWKLYLWVLDLVRVKAAEGEPADLTEKA